MIARDGWTFIIIGLALTVVCLWLATRWDSRIAFGISLVLAILTVFTAYFFRDPDRSADLETGTLVSPGDGVVVEIDTLESHPFIGDKTIQVSVFLSIFDVHVNRVPATGVIDYVDYNPGKFFAAYEDKASELNEQTEIGMVTETGRKVAFKQIAGLIARRVVCRLKAGDNVAAGDRFGLIRFGSRVDLLVPEDCRIDVKLGDRVYGGETVLGKLEAAQPVDNTVTTEEGSDVEL
jgi:phosphatidylserine decarboxylase